MGKKRQRKNSEESGSSDEENQLPATTRFSEEDQEKKVKTKWINKQRVLIFGCRGLGHRDRHLMTDLRSIMPHSKSDSKMHRKKEPMFVVNEIAEMKNCNKCILFESRRKTDLFMWVGGVPRGPSAKFVVENVHTMAELKMTGNCLKGSRPLLSFSKDFDEDPHWSVIRELLSQTFGVPNKHPKSQPFFDRVYTFAIADDRIWFRHYQIVEEDGSLAEIGPRFVLNPIKVFDGGFSGATLWENSKYISPAAGRKALRRLKAGKYRNSVQSKAAFEASRPTEPTYKVDVTDDVFKTLEEKISNEEEEDKKAGKKKSGAKKPKKKKAKLAPAAVESKV